MVIKFGLADHLKSSSLESFCDVVHADLGDFQGGKETHVMLMAGGHNDDKTPHTHTLH